MRKSGKDLKSGVTENWIKSFLASEVAKRLKRNYKEDKRTRYFFQKQTLVSIEMKKITKSS